jgi:hypothetical protein
MSYKREDLLATNAKIKDIIESDKYETSQQVQCAVSRVIFDSPVSAPANTLGDRFWAEWKNCTGPQLTALDLALEHLAADPDVRRLVVARVFSAPPYPFNADHLWDDVLAICNIKFDDDDQGPPDQPKPPWMTELGLKRKRNPGPR